MSTFGPSLKLLKQDVSTVMEGFFSDHTAIVIRPSMDHLIELFDELSLWGMDVLSEKKLQFLDMSFDRLFTRCDDGLEAECISPSICAGMRFSHWKLSHRPAQKITPYLPLIPVQGMSDMSFARLQFQSHVL